MSKVAPIVEETISQPLFERYTLHKIEAQKAMLPGYPVMKLAGKVADIAHGVATILEIKRRDDLEAEFENQKVFFNDADHCSLTCLSIAALELLRDEAVSITEWAYNVHTPEGRAEQRKGVSHE